MRAATLTRLSLLMAGLLGVQSLACTHTADGHVDDPRSALVARRGIVQLVDTDGSSMPVAPETQISFIAKDGSQTDSVQAGLLCRTDWGLTVREERMSSCLGASPLIAWDDIDGVHTDTFDGAATTAIAAGAVIVLVAVVFALSAGKGGSKSSSSSPPPRRSSGSTPTGDVGPPSVARGPLSGGGGGTTVFIGPRVIVPIGGYGTSGSYAPRVTDDDGTLFMRTDLRRATVRGIIGLDGGACVLSPGSCFSAGIRGGVRLYNLAELTLGLRVIQGWGVHDYARATPVLGIAMHGELPNFRGFALSLGGQFSRTAAMDFYANLLLGFRIAPATHWWIGVFPIHPTYLSWSDGRGDLWTIQSSLDLSADF
jgi:hypothetical protein